ncbi:diaminopropionate ammonia-lyase [Kineosporia sp. A_224]|uniref:diaminopropionate ammonia-lyase n=1 Tax=Kineosporia sp. A_224 TaxID=1962180 RepID=UPI000B4B75D0|nr:diaminopropionate ammonia-lyase [Kineosporia sp. A_224]
MTHATWAAHHRDPAWTCPAPAPEVLAFHRALPGYAPTRLVDLPDLARELGVGHVLAKDESDRLGLPAFKALGASWAVHRAVLGRTAERGSADHGATTPLTLVTATDGNHGRAVARFARTLGHRAHVVVPDGVHAAAVQAIADEGATVTAVAGSYDDAVAEAARYAAADPDGAVLVQDTAWEGYEDVPRWIVDGYSTLFAEVDDQLAAAGLPGADAVLVPTGVGSLLQAALAHYRSDRAAPGTAVVSVEPVGAACVLASVAAGRPVAVDTGTTIMAGLNCGTMSTLAWPYVEHGLDASVAVTDGAAARAARDLHDLGVPAGPCGAAPLAALRTLARDGTDDATDRRAHLGLTPASVVVLVVTEGAEANPQTDGPEPR